jgi:hypothetical protein
MPEDASPRRVGEGGPDLDPEVAHVWGETA